MPSRNSASLVVSSPQTISGKFRGAIRAACLIGCLLLAAGSGGCNIIAALANAGPAPDVGPSYTGLKGQTVAVMVWADPAAVIDHPTVQSDLASALTSDLQSVANSKSEDLKGTKFINPMSVFSYQQSHPELEGRPLEEVAPLLGVSRVIYVEVQSLETRSSMSVDLFKGTILSNMKVAEVANPRSTTAPTTAKIVYDDQSIRTIYPPGSPEGVQDVDADEFYHKTISEAAKDLATRFVTHPKPEPDAVGG